MMNFVIPFILFDLVIVVGVIMFVRHRRTMASPVTEAESEMASIVSLSHVRALVSFAGEQHERIGEHMRTNWSGIPDQLPAVLRPLLDEIEVEARAQDLPTDREALKSMLAASLRKHGIGKGGVLGEALKQVA